MRKRNRDVTMSEGSGTQPLLRRLSLVALVATIGVLIGAGVTNAAHTPLTALIDGGTVSGSPSQEEQAAVAQGYTVTVVSAATWASMTQAQFEAYALLVIGDPHCSGTSQTAAANAAVWAPAVMGTTPPGNRVLIGTDPVFHDSGYLSSRATIIRDGLKFAGKQPGTTGLYFDASCSGGGGAVQTALTMLSTGSGAWTADNSPPCGGSVSLIAFEPSFGPPDTLTTASLQGWGCSVHESWPTFPTDWSALAVATDTASHPTCGVDPGTGLSACGEAYILIAGSSIVVTSGSIALTPPDATNPTGTTHTVTAHVTSTTGGSTPVPLVGRLVTFTVTGQNAGAVGVCSPVDCKTDANGEVTFTYTDTNGAGDDTIKASFTDDAGSLQSATAQKHWVGSAATATPTATPIPTVTPTPTATMTPGCGNGIVESSLGETCDPPGSVVGLCGQPCRSDCTFCGDGVVQSADPDLEMCDDGNCVECNLRPPRPINGDKCNNSCKLLMCHDPSRITFRDGLDVFQFHGKLVPSERGMVDFNFGGSEVAIRLTTTGQNLVFETSVPAGAIEALTRGSFRYKNAGAKQDGGIYKLHARLSGGAYRVTAIAYGDLSGAAADMVTYVTIGGREWTVHGLWKRTGAGWSFNFNNLLP